MKTMPLLMSAALALSAGTALADPTEDAMTKAGCLACHAKDKKVVGPSFKDVAAKLMDKVRKGGSGTFGPVPMAPNPPDKIDDATLKSAIELMRKG